MPVEVTGTPVELTSVAIDIVANAPGIERTASRVCFEGTAHPESTRRNSPPVVAARPLKKKLTRLAATPTPVYHDPDRPSVSDCLLAMSMLMFGVIHLFMLVLYYDDELSKAYTARRRASLRGCLELPRLDWAVSPIKSSYSCRFTFANAERTIWSCPC